MSNDYLMPNTSTVGAGSEHLKQLADLVGKIEQLQATVEEEEAQLKRSRAKLAQLSEVDLPALMDEIGLAKVTTTNGREVSITDTLYASVPKKNKREAAEWLMQHGHGSLVSETVVATFEKGEGARVQEVVALLANNGVRNLGVEENMNTGSIKALIRELTQQGEDVPLPLFGAYWKREAVIK